MIFSLSTKSKVNRQEEDGRLLNRVGAMMHTLLWLLDKLGLYVLNGCLILGFYGVISEHFINHSDEYISIIIFLVGAIGIGIRLALRRIREQKKGG